MKIFKSLEIETSSLCNRVCPTCIRNSHPNRNAIKPWFEFHLMPMEIIKEALDQCVKFDYKGSVCLSHYNEPLMDKRIIDIARLVKSYDRFFIHLCTNGDLLTRKMASQLDGILNKITIAMYEKRGSRLFEKLFAKTKVSIKGEHIKTHFTEGIEKTVKCKLHRLIINHRRQYLLCCEDVIGNFNLGTFPEISLQDFWFGENRFRTIRKRRQNFYCLMCPRMFE